jgi:uncharacterized protein
MRKMPTPDQPHSPSPEITPNMVHTAMHALEKTGMIYYSEGGLYVPTESGWKLLMEIGGHEEVIAYGHPDIRATDNTGFAIVKAASPEKYQKAIIAVSADKACKDFDKKFRNSLKSGKKIEIKIEADGMEDKIVAFCSPAFTLTSSEEIAVRKDDRIDGKTVGILANKSAAELNQDLVEKLRNPGTKVKIIFEIK